MLKKAFSNKRAPFKNNSGMAVIEMIPIMIIIVLLINFSLGFFGVIHTGILNSIAARNYAFETFRHRANLNYFYRENSSDQQLSEYSRYGFRFHGIASEKRPQANEEWIASARNIAFVKPFGGVDKNGQDLSINNVARNPEPDLHNNKVFTIRDDGSRTVIGAAPVWIRPIYGICIRSSCQP